MYIILDISSPVTAVATPHPRRPFRNQRGKRAKHGRKPSVSFCDAERADTAVNTSANPASEAAMIYAPFYCETRNCGSLNHDHHLRPNYIVARSPTPFTNSVDLKIYRQTHTYIRREHPHHSPSPIKIIDQCYYSIKNFFLIVE